MPSIVLGATVHPAGSGVTGRETPWAETAEPINVDAVMHPATRKNVGLFIDAPSDTTPAGDSGSHPGPKTSLAGRHSQVMRHVSHHARDTFPNPETGEMLRS